MPRHVDSIKCGSCKGRHTTVSQVALCYKAKREREAQTAREEHDAKVEALAELAAERWFEERGGAEDDPRERELWALEDLNRGFTLGGTRRVRPW